MCLCTCRAISAVVLLVYILAFIYVPTHLDPRRSPKSPYGLVPVTETTENGPAREGGIDIIFVHGLAANPDTTWQARRKASSGEVSTNAHDEPNTFVNWVRDFLPGDIPEELQQNVRLFFFNYDSYWLRDSVNTRLKSIAADLLNRIDVDIRSTERDKSRGLVFVGSSFGGLVVKQALVSAAILSQHNYVVQHTKGVLFLGTPHRGSGESLIGWLIAQALRPLGSSVFLLTLLEYDSPALLDLNRDFINIIGHDCRIINVYELLKSLLIGFKKFGWNTLLVKEASATFNGNGVINIAFRTNHFGLNKFSDKDENYKTLCSHLVRILKEGTKTTERLHGVPFKPVDTYTERHELQQKIEQGLQIRHENRSIAHAVTIIGMGGTGKSQLALNFAETHKEQYNPILWIDATSEDTLRSSFQRCARALKLEVAAPGESGTVTDLYNTASVQMVLEWLRKKTAAGHDDPWLVIVDNADDLTWGIEHVLPSGEHGSIILTSQNDNWLIKQKGSEQIRVDVMTPREASNLLLRHLDMDISTAPEHIQKGCDAVAEKLGYLALAVDLAGYHIANEDEAEDGIERYLAAFDRNRDELLKSTVFQELLPTQKTVWTAWDMTLETLDKHHGNAQTRLLLTWLAHFDGTVIHYAVFNLIAIEFAQLLEPSESRFAKDMPAGLRKLFALHQGEWDSDRCRSAFQLLARYGLLQEVRGILPGVTMHKLVRWRALQDAKDKPWPLWFLTAIDAAGRHIPDIFGYFTLDQTFAAQLPNLRDTLAGIRKAAEVYNYVIGRGLFQILSSQMRFDEAKEVMRHATEMLVRNPEPDNRSKVTSDDLMLMQMSVNLPDMRQEDDRSALPLMISKASSSHDNLNTDASIAHSLAMFYFVQGRLDDAEHLLRGVLKASDFNVSDPRYDIVHTTKALVMVLSDKGRLKEAETLLAQVIENEEIIYGKDHYLTLQSMSDMAWVYKKQGRWQEAEAQLRRVEEGFASHLWRCVEEGRETRGGHDHPGMLQPLRSVAELYLERGMLPEAAARYAQLISVQEAWLGGTYVLENMNVLAGIYEEQGRFDKAETVRLKVIEREKNELSLSRASSRHKLADNYKMQGRLREAEALEREVETEYSTPLLLYEVAWLSLALTAIVWALVILLQTAITTVAWIYRLRQLH